MLGLFYEVEEVKETRGIDEVVEQKKATVITSKANEPDKQSTVRSIICLDYDDLSSAKDDIVGKVGEAFGYEGLGILAVRNVPNLQKLRQKAIVRGKTFCRRSTRRDTEKI